MQIYFTSLSALIPVIFIWLRVYILFNGTLTSVGFFLKNITKVSKK